MYIHSGRSAFAQADETEGVLGATAEHPSHSSNARENRRFQACAAESVAENILRAVRETRFLSPEEELRLASAWRARGDVAAKKRIEEAHLPLVYSITRRLWTKACKGSRPDRPNITISFDDCLGAGCVGLLEASARFNPNCGVRFSSYARKWIDGEVKELINNNRSVVKGSAFDADFSDDSFIGRPLPKGTSRAAAASDDNDAGDEIAPLPAASIDRDHCNDAGRPNEFTQLAPDEITAIPSAPAQVSPDALLAAITIQDDILITSQIPRLRAAISRLKDRDRIIFEARRLADEPVTLDELAERFNISIERVRQIEAKALTGVAEAFLGLPIRPERGGRRVPVAPLPDRCAWLGGVADADNSWPFAWSRDEIAYSKKRAAHG